MEIKGIYFQVKLMNKYISTKYKNNFLLLNIRININFQSRSVVRNSNKNQTYLTHSPSKKENIRKNFYYNRCFSGTTQLNELSG